MIRQELNPVTCKLDRKQINLPTIPTQVQVVDQTTHPPKCHSFVGLDRQIGSSPPALFKKGEEGRKKKKKEVLHLSRCYTHTPGRAGETLKGKRKKKADTLDSTATTLIIQEHNCCIYQQAKTCIYCNARLNVCNRDTASSHFEAR